MDHIFYEAEAKLIKAILCGDLDFSRFQEGGDYQRIWAERVRLENTDRFLKKLARLPSHRVEGAP